MYIYEKDHEWSRALRVHLLNEFRESSHAIFEANYPINGMLQSMNQGFEQASLLAKKADDLFQVAEEMAGNPNRVLLLFLFLFFSFLFFF